MNRYSARPENSEAADVSEPNADCPDWANTYLIVRSQNTNLAAKIKPYTYFTFERNHMKRTILVLMLVVFAVGSADAQQLTTTTPRKFAEYVKPAWTIGFGGVWNLATNDAYGRANYSDPSMILKDNYGMRWGWGAYLNLKYGLGKKKQDRIYLGFDYKGMTNSDFESDANKTSYDIVTIAGGYEYLFFGTSTFRSYYGGGVTANFVSGKFTPSSTNQLSTIPRSIESSFRIGLEVKSGLEFIIKNKNRNLGINLGARYNLMNLFNDDNAKPELGQTEDVNLNDGDDPSSGPGFKRYIGMVSVDVGLNIYPDAKRIIRTR